MAYQLKSTGIAANCTMCIAVDPDTGTLKDFASSAVTADMTVSGSLVISDGTWDGNTRKKITLSAGNYIAFGATKPAVSLTSTDTQLTAVMCVEAAGGAVRVFGLNSTNYFASQNLAAGTNFPTFRNSSNVAQGSASVPTSGQKWIFGASMTWNTSTTLYRALHDAASMSSESGTTFNVSTSYSPSYIGRRDDSTTQQNDGIFLVALFNTALSESEWDSLRDDWFGTLLESAGDAIAPVLSSPTGTATGSTTATVGATTDEANGTQYAVVTTSATAPSAAQIKAGQDHTGSAATWGGSITISATGANTHSATGLTASTGYYAHLIHTDAAANDSNIVTSAQFTTNAAASAITAATGAATVSAAGESLAESTVTAAAGAATVSAVGGTLTVITSSAFKNNTGTVLSSLTNVTAWVHNPTTGALVVKLTGQTTNGSGVLTLNDAAIVSATTYRVVYRNEDDGAEGMETVTAS